MPQTAAEDIGRPVPRKLEIEVVRKFMKYDSQYADEDRIRRPDLVKPPPEVGAPGTGGVKWVGLNVDPCKAKWLAKCGINRGDNSKDGEVRAAPAKKGFSLGSFLDTAPLPYPHWQGGLHGPFERPKTERPQTESGLSRAQSLPASRRGDAKSQVSKRTSMLSSVATRASVAKYVSEELQRQLGDMSCHQHYLEQTFQMPGAPASQGDCKTAAVVKPAPTPADLNELLYSGISAHGQGRAAYLDKRHRIMPQERSTAPMTAAAEVGWKAYGGKGVWVGKMLKRMQPPPDTLAIC